MKVCVFGLRSFPLTQGGVEKHCECLYPLIASDEVQITVFRRKPYVRFSAEKYENIRFIDLPSTKRKGVEAVWHSLLATIRCIAICPDIVHIHNIGPALFSPLLKLFRLKIVLTYHSPNYEHDKWGFFARNILKLSEKIALATANRVIFVSDLQRQKYNKKVREKSLYIPNGINPPQFEANDDYLQSIGVEKGKYILAVGRITPEKGFDYLIRAFNKAQLRDYKLVIAGGVEREQAYDTDLKRNAPDKAVFTGYITGKPLSQLYTHAASFVLPSYNEGMPIVLLEAMSYGLPIIASDIPANKAINLPKESYFNVGDEEDLSNHLANIQKKNIHYEIPDSNKWRQIAEKTVDIFKCVSNNRIKKEQR
jgi:glycosyltransferase involved in cell wall biosynthesis